MKRNVFIKSLEFGEDKIEQGISFNELLEYLKDELDVKFKDKDKRAEFEKSFNVWFYDNFFLREVQKTRAGIREVPALDLMQKSNDKKARLKGEAYFKLIEYKELAESRKSSRKAFYIAAFAAFLTFSSVIYQIGFDGKKENSIVDRDYQRGLKTDSIINQNISKIDSKLDSMIINIKGEKQQALIE